MEFLKKMFLEGYATSNITLTTAFACILCTLVLALYIYLVYKMINKKSFYNKSFNLSIIVIALITASIILTIQSNIVVSLGMVGALSIVRFRTAIKDPMDLAFLFWSISVGIICGAGFAAIAVIASLVITLVLVLFEKAPADHSDKLLVVNGTDYKAEEKILEIVKSDTQFFKVRARTVSKNDINIVIEIGNCDEGKLVGKLVELESVSNASVVEHDGNVTC